MSTLLNLPVRYLITSGDLTEQNFHESKQEFLSIVRLAAERGIELIQIREKLLDAQQVFELAKEAVRVINGSDTRLLVNERFDIAAAAGAGGVQLTSRAIPTEAARRNVPTGFLIGVSTHSEREVLAAKRDGADFALLGSIFTTPGKGEPLGLEKLTAVCNAAGDFPVIAVGGVDAENQLSVVDAGAAGFAAIRYLNEFVTIGE